MKQQVFTRYDAIAICIERFALLRLVVGLSSKFVYAAGAAILLYVSVVIVLSLAGYGLSSIKQGLIFWVERFGALLLCFGSSTETYYFAATLLSVPTVIYALASGHLGQAMEEDILQLFISHLSRSCAWVYETVAMCLIGRNKVEEETDGSSSENVAAKVEENIETPQLERDCTVEGNRENSSMMGDSMEEEEDSEETVDEASEEEKGWVLIESPEERRWLNEEPANEPRQQEAETNCSSESSQESRPEAPQGPDCCSSCQEKDEFIRKFLHRDYFMDMALEHEELKNELLSMSLEESEEKYADLLAKTHEKDEAIRKLQEENAYLLWALDDISGFVRHRFGVTALV